jgi:DNA-binding MarR family transcriptional regulator
MTTSRRSSPARRVRTTTVTTTASAAAAQQAPEARALLDALQAVARELRLTERRGRAPLGLPPAQLRALRELATRSAASLAELAERTYTDPSSASVVVQRLVERGLVVRVDSERDRRRTELRATPAGRALVARAPADAVARVADALSPLGGRQAASLSRGLQALARGLRSTPDEDADAAGA